jgi:hypothetical protein
MGKNIHVWRDIDWHSRAYAKTVNIVPEFQGLLGEVKEINGMGTFCDGDKCGPSDSGTYVIHRAPCMALASSRSDEENAMYDEDCD